MLNGQERESYAERVLEEVRRWVGVETRPHVFGRQIGHVHADGAVHLTLTKGLKDAVVREQLAEAVTFAPTSAWAMLNPMRADDAARAVWLLRLNYVRLRRQRMTPLAAASSALLQEHEAALAPLSPNVARLLQRTQLRSRTRPLPSLDSPGSASRPSASPPLA